MFTAAEPHDMFMRNGSGDYECKNGTRHAGLFLNAHVRFYALLLFNVNYEGGAKKIASRSIFNLDTKGNPFRWYENLQPRYQLGKHQPDWERNWNPAKSINQSIRLN